MNVIAAEHHAPSECVADVAVAGRGALLPPFDVLTLEDAGQLVEQLTDALEPVLRFIAKGHTHGTMGLRAWALLHATRIDLIGGEAMAPCAQREGISHTRVYEFVQEFRASVPAFHMARRKSALTRARMRRTHVRNLERAAAQTAPATPG